jgi:hypothetical protein
VAYPLKRSVELQKVLEAYRLLQPSIAIRESFSHYSFIILVINGSGTSFQAIHSL